MNIVYIADTLSYIVNVDCRTGETKTKIVLSYSEDLNKAIPVNA